MKKATTYKAIIGSIITLFCCNVIIAQSEITDGATSPNNYEKLKALGFNDLEIYEDLGNANFLTQNYDKAIFWYDKLMSSSVNGSLNSGCQERYQYSLKQLNSKTALSPSEQKDWEAIVKADYLLKKKYLKKDYDNSSEDRFKELVFEPANAQFSIEEKEPKEILSFIGKNKENSKEYDAPITLTANGKTAYFSKTDYVKPMYGMFSKKELVHKIYKAEKVDGVWTNFEKVAVCPKNSSAKHPAVSADGKRLFFASNMPGSFGEYDIYVADLYKNGKVGVSKNLGQKVNTKKNDLYPSLVDGSTLFFASEGRKGHGGLDIYMTQVGQNRVDLAMNMGSPINSKKDDFSISFKNDKGGFVMSNRGGDSDLQRVAFTSSDRLDTDTQEQGKYNSMEAIRKSWKVDYSTSVYEDE
ncbi:hypothetical protein GGR42_000579 [Saonia flava]|uniref:WD40-like Beta Propeller Repeat n=1 Tax=Saonia flava TaxID=523696 RepID=A0A846QSD8_9FLAO|nr:PD40 domain-containing protein [Saonia flava]NJB70117.1 hypothetical protein [Saonia flava]